ncbi:Hypothetical predicted protein [Paramuricea clavata]|uniref:Uncharacterized protein n=1 Tax=Paramuricea clavata TaxID=317549 RepID=A0A7D9JHK9_PARCT|nr:Hypothetical predicted protein [Paramuricea clavata]
MQIESVTKGLEEFNNENPVNKMGKYSFKNMKKKPEAGKPRSCYYCGQDIKTSVIAHLKSCRARTSTCNFCDAIGHYETVCRKKKAINELKNDSEQQEHQIEDHDHSGVYSINIFRITETPQQQPPHKRRMKTRDFNAQVIINNSLAKVLADTGQSAVQLGIIQFDPQPEVYQPVQIIQCSKKEALQDILKKYPQNFEGLGKLKNHQVKLHVDPSVKPVASPARPVPYHLKERIRTEIDKITAQDVIEEHPSTEPAPLGVKRSYCTQIGRRHSYDP